MDAKELLLSMGFEHEQHTDYYQLLDGSKQIMTCHCVTHPDIPGLFLSGKDLKDCMKGVVWAIITLTLLNDAKLSMEQVNDINKRRTK